MKRKIQFADRIRLLPAMIASLAVLLAFPPSFALAGRVEVNSAKELIDSGLYDQAITVLQTETQNYNAPDKKAQAEAYVLMACLRQMRGDSGKAHELIKQGITINAAIALEVGPMITKFAKGIDSPEVAWFALEFYPQKGPKAALAAQARKDVTAMYLKRGDNFLAQAEASGSFNDSSYRVAFNIEPVLGPSIAKKLFAKAETINKKNIRLSSAMFYTSVNFDVSLKQAAADKLIPLGTEAIVREKNEDLGRNIFRMAGEYDGSKVNEAACNAYYQAYKDETVQDGVAKLLQTSKFCNTHNAEIFEKLIALGTDAVVKDKNETLSRNFFAMAEQLDSVKTKEAVCDAFWKVYKDGKGRDGVAKLLEKIENCSAYSAELYNRVREVMGADEFVTIKGGCYQMGNNIVPPGWLESKIKAEMPAHKVCVSDFKLQKYEVTKADFMLFKLDPGNVTVTKDAGECYTRHDAFKQEKHPGIDWRNPGFSQTLWDPVVCVSYDDVQNYIVWRSKKDGVAYRLTTEAEWEYAARSGGKDYRYSWGNSSKTGNLADGTSHKATNFFGGSDYNENKNYIDGYVYTAPVGSFTPNEIGLYDMTGNVWEWCSDWFDNGYYSRSPIDDPQGADKNMGSGRSNRGSSWTSMSVDDRVHSRHGHQSNEHYDNLGFRLVLPVK